MRSGRTADSRVAFRAECKVLTHTRLDPIVNCGQAPSPHLHSVFGSEHFSPVVSAGDLAKPFSTSCNIREDGSMYWNPALYGVIDGVYDRIPTFAFVYYMTYGKDEHLHAYPRGLRMVMGDATKRSGPGLSDGDRPGNQVNWHAHYEEPNGNQGLSDDAYGEFPPMTTGNRESYMWQARMAFPSCWDGVNLDSPDHLSHMTYVYDGGPNAGKCPSSHPVQVPELKYEALFRINPFKAKMRDAKGREATSADFVLSNGDPTGASMHSDFLSGWDEDVMARALKDCSLGKGGCPLSFYDPDGDLEPIATMPDAGESTDNITMLPGNPQF